MKLLIDIHHKSVVSIMHIFLSMILLLSLPMAVQSAPKLDSTNPQPAQSIQTLVDALRSKNDQERITAARYLGEFGPAAKTSANALTQSLKDPNPELRLYAAGALSKIAPDSPSTVAALPASGNSGFDSAPSP